MNTEMEKGKQTKNAHAMLVLLLLVGVACYIGAFVVVHRSSTLRRPATNMAYWYYSDNDALEAAEFYGFWPLRQITYKFFPGFMSHHYRERVYQEISYPPEFND
jgi:hypothetical protein